MNQKVCLKIQLLFNVSFVAMYLFATALTNVAAKTACNKVIAFSGTTQKAFV